MVSRHWSIVTAVALITLAPITFADMVVTMRGAGTVSCGTWLAITDRREKSAYVQWTTGYLSAHNY